MNINMNSIDWLACVGKVAILSIEEAPEHGVRRQRIATPIVGARQAIDAPELPYLVQLAPIKLIGDSVGAIQQIKVNREGIGESWVEAWNCTDQRSYTATIKVHTLLIY